MLLILAPVMLNLMAGVFESARMSWVVFGFDFADFANKDMEVRRPSVVPNESGKGEFLYRHQIPPAVSIADIQFAGVPFSKPLRLHDVTSLQVVGFMRANAIVSRIAAFPAHPTATLLLVSRVG